MFDSHHIETLKFDFEIPSLSKSKEVQNRSVSLFNTQFTAMLNEVFNTYGKDKDINIEALNLNLEPVLVDNFEKHIIRQTRTQLIAYFEREIKKDTLTSNGSVSISKTKTTVNPIFYFLFNGVVIWNDKDNLPFHKKWNTSINDNYFISEVKNAIWNKSAIRRLIFHLNEEKLYKTIQKIESSNANRIIKHHQYLIFFYKNQSQLKAFSFLRFNQIIFEISLSFLLIEKHSKFSWINFLKYHINQLSVLLGYDLDALIKELVNPKLQSKNKNIQDSEYLILSKELLQWSSATTVDVLTNKVSITVKEVEKLLLNKKRTDEELVFLKNWLVDKQNYYNIKELWIANIKEDLLINVVAVFAPKDSKIILEYHDEVLNTNEVKSVTGSVLSIKRVIWQFTIDYLFEAFNSFFQAKEFVKRHLEKLSNHYGISYSILFESLVTSLSVLSESDIKNTEFLKIIKALKQERAQSNRIEGNFKKEDFTIKDVLQILENNQNISWQQSQNIKIWLLKEYKAKRINKHYDSVFNQSHFTKIIKQLSQIHFYFIDSSKSVIWKIFNNDNTNSKTIKDLKKHIDISVVDFLLVNSKPFNKTMFVEDLVKTIMQAYKIDYRIMLANYTNYLKSNKNILDKDIEFVSIFNELQLKLEKAYGIKSCFESSNYLKVLYDKINEVLNNSILDEKFKEVQNLKSYKNPTLNIDQLFDFFNHYRMSIKQTADSNKALSIEAVYNNSLNYLAHLVGNNSEKYFAFLEEKKEVFTIEKDILSKMNPSELRCVLTFEAQYVKWVKYKKEVVKSIPNSASQNITAVIFYLNSGVFPKWISKLAQQSLLRASFLKKEKTTLLQTKWTSKMIEVWAANFTKKSKTEVLQAWTKNQSNHAIILFYKKLETIYSSLPPNRRPISFYNFEVSFWNIFIKAKTQNKFISSIAFTKYFFKQLELELSIDLFKNETLFKLLLKSENFPETLFHFPEKDRHLKSGNKEDGIIKQNEFIEISNSKNENYVIENQLVKWYIINAGLILTHPFLSHLFKTLQYLNIDNKFKDEASKWRAVYLLHYLATGNNDEVEETELVISKILCGMEISDPIPTILELNQEEKDMAEELLTILISRWEKLGQTSNDGLRGTFILREGIIEKQEDTYLLTVEDKGVDVLLDFIPWSINFIKLPWLNNIIYTSWR